MKLGEIKFSIYGRFVTQGEGCGAEKGTRVQLVSAIFML